MTNPLPRAAIAALALALLPSGAALARNGGGGSGSSYGESYYNDMQRNPRLIEPGADRTRYLAQYGREGWDQRQAAAQGYDYGGYYSPPPRGYRSPYRGQVTVRPYGY